MTNHEISRLKSMGEAHLYAAVARADGVVSAAERTSAPVYAVRSQARYDILKMNRKIAETIRHDVFTLLHDPRYASWTAQRHLDEGMEKLTGAKKLGGPGLGLTAAKVEQELQELAYLDGYDMRESLFVKTLLLRLAELE